MNIWLVNPFDPLPGEAEQLARYGRLALTLKDRGHRVTWWSASFSHRFKRSIDARSVDAAAHELGIDVRLIDTPPYRKNISLRRLWSHASFGRRWRVEAEAVLARQSSSNSEPRALARADAAEQDHQLPSPDLILASSPPLESAAHVATIGKRYGIATIIDIQDQWPDYFAYAFPRPLRGVARPLLARHYAHERRAYRLATAITAVAEGYLERGLQIGGSKAMSAEFPLGVDLGEVDAAMRDRDAAESFAWKKREGEVWAIMFGSFAHSYDLMTIVRAAARARKTWGTRVRFFFAGRGELEASLRREVERLGLDNVVFTGFLAHPNYGPLLAQADLGFTASFPDSLVHLPNKVFFYFAAGVSLLNTIPGECARIIDDAGCGLTYQAGNADACFDAIRHVVDDPAALPRMKAASRNLAETRFDRRIILPHFAEFLELAARVAHSIR